MDQRSFLRMMEPIIRPLKQRIMMAVARGILESVKDDGGIQLVKLSLLKDETREDIERIQNFGFTSVPPAGSESVAVFVGGNREHGFVVGCDHRASRKKGLKPGECAVYTDDGTFIILEKGGKVTVKAATSLTVDVPDSTFKGNVKVEGKIESTGDLTVGGKADVTGNVTSSANVIGGGTDLAAVKVFGTTHTHNIITPVPGSPTTPPIPPL